MHNFRVAIQTFITIHFALKVVATESNFIATFIRRTKIYRPTKPSLYMEILGFFREIQ